MDTVCKYHIVKPFAGEKDTRSNSAAEVRLSGDAKEYCTHPDSRHLLGTPEGVICGGDFLYCEIPRDKLKA